MQQNKNQQKKGLKKPTLKPVGKTKYRNLKSNYTLLGDDEDDIILSRLEKENFMDEDDEFDEEDEFDEFDEDEEDED